MVADRGACLAQRNDFRVRRRIMIGNVSIKSAADDLTLVYNYGPYRNFANFERALRRAQGFFHPEFIGIGAIRIRCWGWPHRQHSSVYSPLPCASAA